MKLTTKNETVFSEKRMNASSRRVIYFRLVFAVAAHSVHPKLTHYLSLYCIVILVSVKKKNVICK